MLDRTVELVKKAAYLGVWVIHVTEGYSNDYRELDPTNPGGFTESSDFAPSLEDRHRDPIVLSTAGART